MLLGFCVVTMEKDTSAVMELDESIPKEERNNNRDTPINVDEGTPLPTPLEKRNSHMFGIIFT